MAGQIVRATIADLKAHPPFDRMEGEALQFLATRLQVAYYPKGVEVVGPSGGVVARLYIVKKGSVRSSASGLPAGERASVDAVRGAGECFPIGALIGRRQTQYSYRTEEDSFLYELDEQSFRQVVELSPHFHKFCTAYLASLVDQSRRELRTLAHESMSDVQGMLEPLAGLLSRAPVSCRMDTPVGEALATMRDQRIGSMVVVDAADVPVGIFTRPDVVSRVALAGVPLSSHIGEVMTPEPVTLPAEAPLFEAALAMAKHGIQHVVVVRDGRLAGVVSERDLFALQRVSLQRIAQRIRGGTSVEALREAATGIRDLVRNLLAQGFGAEHLTQVISSLNDILTERLIKIVGDRHALLGKWCWIALGSEGRSEQTFATDQDNALILEAGAQGAPGRNAWLAFAGEVNSALDACGFPLCKGEIMARNPDWCLTLDEWRAAFSGWIRNPEPRALLNGAIFFDFRSSAGDAELAGDLRLWVLDQAAGNPAFLRAMAANALQVKPPIGFLHNFITDDSAEFRGTIDLKKFGVRPFVDAARILALAHRAPHTNTVARLRHAGQAGVLPEEEAGSAAAAFLFIQTLRVKHQYLQELPALGFENRVAPASMNALDRRILKEAFRQGAKLQEKLRLDYGL